jgi:hypothetical protein
VNAKEMFFNAASTREFYLPVANVFLTDVIGSAAEVGIEILERKRFNDKLTILKIKAEQGALSIFNLGAFVLINRMAILETQKNIDNPCEEQLQ